MHGLIWGPRFLPSFTVSGAQQTYFNGLFHLSDWVPTLLSAATTRDPETALALLKDSRLDGVDQWASIVRTAATVQNRSVIDDLNAVLEMSEDQRRELATQAAAAFLVDDERHVDVNLAGTEGAEKVRHPCLHAFHRVLRLTNHDS